ncbi:MAG: hypothetical protein NWQ38_04515 [Cellulophaga sp.]|nr:hypothetical protein [Cellulophaga sp.]
MATKQELIQRWDGFLAKIEARFNESLVHAEEACVGQLEETDYDYYTVIRAWQGMKSQLYTLIQKIDETWHQKVEPEMRELGDFWTDESYKSSKLSDKLSLRLDKFQRSLEGNLSQRFYDHVMSKAPKHTNCSQCNAEIALKTAVFRAQYVICSFCNTVNTFEPTTQFNQIGWNIVDTIAATKTQHLFELMEEASEAIRLQRKPVDQKYWDDYKKAYFDYYEGYFKARIQLNTEAEARYDADMQRKTKEYEEYERIQRN